MDGISMYSNNLLHSIVLFAYFLLAYLIITFKQECFHNLFKEYLVGWTRTATSIQPPMYLPFSPFSPFSALEPFSIYPPGFF